MLFDYSLRFQSPKSYQIQDQKVQTISFSILYCHVLHLTWSFYHHVGVTF